MANFAWPHTPASYLARLLLADGPFAGDEPAFVPPDTGAPVQIVWSGWIPGVGFTACLYEWHGETTTDQGRTDALVFRDSGRRLTPDDIPPVIAEDTELWADTAARVAETLADGLDIPRGLLWPGL